MKRNSFLSAASIGALLFFLLGCSKRDRVIKVADDDPSMAVAIAKAQSTLPHFWQVLDRPERGEAKFALKVRITDKKGSEHFWTTEIERRDGKITGTIGNDPNIVSTVKLGERIEIPEANISDWLYMRGGKMIGNETIKPLFKTMPAEKAQRLKAIMEDP